MDNNSKWNSALLGGVVIGVVSGIPILNFINCACCAGVIGGGMFTIYLYRRQQAPEGRVSMSDGALLGFLAGVIGAVIAVVLTSITGSLSVNFLDFVSQYISDPDIQSIFDEIPARTLTGGTFIIGLIINLIINSIFGLVGGILGVALFGKARMV